VYSLTEKNKHGTFFVIRL